MNTFQNTERNSVNNLQIMINNYEGPTKSHQQHIYIFMHTMTYNTHFVDDEVVRKLLIMLMHCYVYVGYQHVKCVVHQISYERHI